MMSCLPSFYQEMHLGQLLLTVLNAILGVFLTLWSSPCQWSTPRTVGWKGIEDTWPGREPDFMLSFS